MKPEYAIAAGIAALVVLVAVLVWLLLRRKKGPEIKQALEAVAIARLQHVLVPDGMGGHIQVEHLLLTGQGLVVIDAKSFAGTIFASERMEEWTVIGKQGRFTFPNPLPTLYDRVAALRQLARDVLSSTELVERSRRPEKEDIERLLVAFAPHWDRVKAAIEPAP